MLTTGENTNYLLFYSKGVYYSNKSFDIQDKVLKIMYKSEVQEGLRMSSLFLIETKNGESYDTIELENNGESDHLNNITIKE